MSVELDNVVAAETVLSHVDGQAGQLILRGLPLGEAASSLDFEGVCALLWDGFTPASSCVATALADARTAAFEQLAAILPATDGLTAIEGLRLLLSGLSDDTDLEPAVQITGAMAVFVAAIGRRQRGREPIAPDPSLGHAADFLAMLNDAEPNPALVARLDTYLVTVADHGLNASTFAARVVASTRAGMVSSIVAALCALKGPLHGGAPGPVLDMLDDIGGPERIDAWLQEALARGDRLMGFGHRVYRVRDPRADVLKSAVSRLQGERIAFAEQVEKAAIAHLARHKPDRRLETNVEFYTALLLDRIGLDRSLFTPVFAIGRVAGWSAHVMEQVDRGRLIRPRSRYMGPAPLRAA
ncbi:MAG: citrate synthase/methylcitrate synthase [Pseudomonadota bacterium]